MESCQAQKAYEILNRILAVMIAFTALEETKIARKSKSTVLICEKSLEKHGLCRDVWIYLSIKFFVNLHKVKRGLLAPSKDVSLMEE